MGLPFHTTGTVRSSLSITIFKRKTKSLCCNLQPLASSHMESVNSSLQLREMFSSLKNESKVLT